MVYLNLRWQNYDRPESNSKHLFDCIFQERQWNTLRKKAADQHKCSAAKRQNRTEIEKQQNEMYYNLILTKPKVPNTHKTTATLQTIDPNECQQYTLEKLLQQTVQQPSNLKYHPYGNISLYPHFQIKKENLLIRGRM